MDDPERTRCQLSAPETGADNRVLLNAIRGRLQTDPSVYFAGELTNPKDDGGRFDEYDLFIAPRTPCFDPEELTAFTERVLAGFNMTSTRRARIHQNGDLQLPDAFIDQHIGDREVKFATTTRINIGSFKGQTTETVVEETHPEQLIQRTTVKVFTDPLFAQTLFDYCGALMRQELDVQRSTNIFAVYATHVVPARYLADLKGHYQSSGNNLPQLPQAK